MNSMENEETRAKFIDMDTSPKHIRDLKKQGAEEHVQCDNIYLKFKSLKIILHILKVCIHDEIKT